MYAGSDASPVAGCNTNPLMSQCKSGETLGVVSIVRVIPNTPIAATEGQDETLKAITENWKCNSSVGLVAPSYEAKSRRTETLKPSRLRKASSSAREPTLYPMPPYPVPALNGLNR